MSIEKYIWKFPEKISITDVPLYNEHVLKLSKSQSIVFDLSNVTDIHVSFIGFLISLNNSTESNTKIQIIPSDHIKKLFKYLNITSYFNLDKDISPNIKIA